jgi:nucleoside-diphosphate-sugar epimerase
MENLLINSTNKFLIFRLPQVYGKNGNKNNLINFLVDRINSNEKFDLISVKRSIIDVEDVTEIVNHFIQQNNKIFNIGGIQTVFVFEIVNILEKILNKKAIYNNLTDSESCYYENSEEINKFIKENINLSNYTESVLKKYILQ